MFIIILRPVYYFILIIITVGVPYARSSPEGYPRTTIVMIVTIGRLGGDDARPTLSHHALVRPRVKQRTLHDVGAGTRFHRLGYALSLLIIIIGYINRRCRYLRFTNRRTPVLYARPAKYNNIIILSASLLL